MPLSQTKNPFRPGAGHPPPYLAGRKKNSEGFLKLLSQEVILSNLVLTGLRGIGKTVLLEEFKYIALQEKWFWARADLSESTSISEENLVIRILTDIAAAVTGSVGCSESKVIGYSNHSLAAPCTYAALRDLYEKSLGLASDKLKAVLEFVWIEVQKCGRTGIVFAYDEAQNLENNVSEGQFSFSLLLDVFQSVQSKGMRFILVLSGLPTIFPKLVEARTFTERMFEIMFLRSLDETATLDAIKRPLINSGLNDAFSPAVVRKIWETSYGYPYFVQYMCCELFDLAAVHSDLEAYLNLNSDVVESIIQKLDSDFFAGRWSRVTDRQRELLKIISSLANCDSEFTVQEIAGNNLNRSIKSFGNSHVNQMLSSLSDLGIIYKNRYGKYSFAIPLFSQFIKRSRVK